MKFNDMQNIWNASYPILFQKNTLITQYYCNPYNAYYAALKYSTHKELMF